MLGQVRQPCLELQRKVPGGWRSVLLSGVLKYIRHIQYGRRVTRVNVVLALDSKEP